MSVINLIVGRLHAHTNDPEVLDYVYSRMKPEGFAALPGRKVFYWASECLRVHHENQVTHIKVMRGNL